MQYIVDRGGYKLKVCNDCNSHEGTSLKEFDNNTSYSLEELSNMTEVCTSCEGENISDAI